MAYAFVGKNFPSFSINIPQETSCFSVTSFIVCFSESGAFLNATSFKELHNLMISSFVISNPKQID